MSRSGTAGLPEKLLATVWALAYAVVLLALAAILAFGVAAG